MNLFDSNLTYGDIVNQIKQFVIDNNTNNSTLLQELNVKSSNISTLVDIVAYVYMVSNFKNEMYFGEFSLTDATIPSNQIKRAMELGVIIQSKKSSSIKLKIRSKTNDLIVDTKAGSTLSVVSKTNPNLQFIYECNDSIVITPSTEVELEFKQLQVQPSQVFTIDTNYKSVNNYISLQNAFDIDYNTFSITDSNNVEFIRFDNTYDVTSIDNTKKYYIMDFTDSTSAKIRFLGGFIGAEYKGNVTVKYNTTFGSLANGISDTDLKFKSTDITLSDNSSLSISDLIIIPSENKTNNGTDEVDTNLLKFIAPTTFKSKNSIITKDDLKSWFKLNFGGYESIIIGADDLYTNVIPGRIYVYLYKIVNNKVINFDYNDYDWTELYSKLSLGCRIVWSDVCEVNTRVKSTAVVSKNVNASVITNQIQSIIVGNFNNSTFFTKHGIQQKIMENGISGLIGFNIDSVVTYYSKDIVISSNTSSFNYKLNSYNKVSDTLYNNIIDSYLSNYNITDINGNNKKVELSDKLKNNFTNITPENLIFHNNDSFYVLTIPSDLTTNNIKDVNLKPLSKILNNISFSFIFSSNTTITSVTSLTPKVKTSINNDGSKLTVEINNVKLRQVTLNDSTNSYFIDEDITVEITIDEIKYNIWLFNQLDSTLSKKLLGLYNTIDAFGNTKNYIVVNTRLQTQTLTLENAPDLTLSLTTVETSVNVDNYIFIKGDSVLLFKRDDITTIVQKI